MVETDDECTWLAEGIVTEHSDGYCVISVKGESETFDVPWDSVDDLDVIRHERVLAEVKANRSGNGVDAEIQDYVRWLTAHVLDYYDVQHARPVFRNRDTSACSLLARGAVQLLYGYANVRSSYDVGFREYATVARRIGYRNKSLKGMAGVHMIGLHECVHALQWSRNGGAPPMKGGRRDWHGWSFVTIYRELLAEFSYAQCEYEYDLERG
jgi:hypothetical protein